MSDPKIAIQKTLVHEGGISNNPNDSGGLTNMGITQTDLPETNIRNLTVDQAVAYYTEHYWKALYSQIDSQDVADKLFDMGVLFGVGTAVRMMQTVLNLLADGIFGLHTLAHVNEAEPTSLLQAYKTGLVAHAVGICDAQPKDRIFLAGWVRRINS